MEIPRFWRLSPSTKGFRTETVVDDNHEPLFLRYPGGEIPLNGGIEEVEARLSAKGFNDEAIEKILFSVYGAVATESPIPEEETINSLLKFLRSEVGEQYRSEEKLGVN